MRMRTGFVPHIVGERNVPAPPLKPKCPSKYRKRGWTRYICHDCGEEKWILDTVLSDLKKSSMNYDDMVCKNCYITRRDNSRREVRQAVINLGRRRKAMRVQW